MSATVLRNDLDTTFRQARQDGRGVLIPYLTGGFPDPAGYAELAIAVLEAGADALEIGIPFSDPLLDGPAIQRSQQVALGFGVTPADCLGFASSIHSFSDKPLLFMSAYNPLFAYGVHRFCQDAKKAGVSAVIVPDLPYEEQAQLAGAAEDNALHLIQMVAPTSAGERIRRACEAASGFVYCISLAGVTGARGAVADTARPLVKRVRNYTGSPVAVGFGISSPASAREVVEFADGVIVGSALINLLGETAPAQRTVRTCEFVSTLRSMMRRVSPGKPRTE